MNSNVFHSPPSLFALALGLRMGELLVDLADSNPLPSNLPPKVFFFNRAAPQKNKTKQNKTKTQNKTEQVMYIID